MKIKNFNKRLVLNKVTVASLDSLDMQTVYAGNEPPCPPPSMGVENTEGLAHDEMLIEGKCIYIIDFEKGNTNTCGG